MRNVITKIYEFVSALWQFPQVIAGLLLLLYYKPSRQYVTHDGQGRRIWILYSLKKKGSSCFGPIIYVSTCLYRKEEDKALGMRSVRQSLVKAETSKTLGPFYFLLANDRPDGESGL